ncbi:MAG: aspartate--tRNA ligase [Clostridiales bacterium]|nr:aspartate--tRNA ligase [Clostridiales bacterium]
MAESLGSLKRTHYCGVLTEGDIGKRVCVMGWVQRRRDLGSLLFIDLRDRTGLVQLAFDEQSDPAVREKGVACRSEYVVAATGVVRERQSKNPNLPTGSIEVYADELRILAEAETPPFEIVEGTKANEELRLKHRYLDLRRPDLMKNLLFRHRVAKLTRDYFDENGFIEIETPMLIRSTPEGARDYLVPSRVHKGSFYALPQSPQLYKQLSMVAGFDRYIQLARCFRDEDLRADRQPEFTQIDMEMSFADETDIMQIIEGFMKRLFAETLGVELQTPLPRYTYRECMERFGSDKPDMRYGMEIIDVSETVAGCGFAPFESALDAGGSVRGINAKNAYEKLTRKELDKLTDYIKGCGAKGLAWVKLGADGVTASFAKAVSPELLTALAAKMDGEPGDVLLLASGGDTGALLGQLGALRIEAANRLGVEKRGYNLLWVVEMPFFEYDAESGEYVAMHHPFTAPLEECLPYLDTDKAAVRARAYDLVLNGIELASGSVRITDPALQNRIFGLLGLSKEEANEKFGFLLEAFRYGPPPHCGIGLGLDRLVMQLLGADSLRDVIAFPKVQNASELMTECPAAVPEQALRELGITTEGNSLK